MPGAVKSGGKGRLLVEVEAVEVDEEGDGNGPGRKGRAAGRGGNWVGWLVVVDRDGRLGRSFCRSRFSAWNIRTV
jgi:hypothetical protein